MKYFLIPVTNLDVRILIEVVIRSLKKMTIRRRKRSPVCEGKAVIFNG